jgi:hypothetical protein
MAKLSAIMSLTLGGLLFQIVSCTHMDKDDFCMALRNNDRAAVGKQLEPLLAEIKPLGPARQEGFDRIKAWIESHDCVDTVEMAPGMLRSEPPIKEFFIKLKDASDTPFRIRITVYPEKFQFHAE